MTAGTAHVRFHWYKKGTGHLPFKRPDLVDQCNRILAKHYLEALVHTIRGSHTYHIASRVFVSGRVAVASGVLAPRGQETAPALVKLSRLHGRPPSAPATLHASQ